MFISREFQVKYPMINPVILETLCAHANTGRPSGSFVHAVLCNDLKESFGRADMGNRMTLFDIVGFVYNELPSDCWGSPEIVKQWQQLKSKK